MMHVVEECCDWWRDFMLHVCHKGSRCVGTIHLVGTRHGCFLDNIRLGSLEMLVVLVLSAILLVRYAHLIVYSWIYVLCRYA